MRQAGPFQDKLMSSDGASWDGRDHRLRTVNGDGKLDSGAPIGVRQAQAGNPCSALGGGAGQQASVLNGDPGRQARGNKGYRAVTGGKLMAKRGGSSAVDPQRTGQRGKDP